MEKLNPKWNFLITERSEENSRGHTCLYMAMVTSSLLEAFDVGMYCMYNYSLFVQYAMIDNMYLVTYACVISYDSYLPCNQFQFFNLGTALY